MNYKNNNAIHYITLHYIMIHYKYVTDTLQYFNFKKCEYIDRTNSILRIPPVDSPHML